MKFTKAQDKYLDKMYDFLAQHDMQGNKTVGWHIFSKDAKVEKAIAKINKMYEKYNKIINIKVGREA